MGSKGGEKKHDKKERKDKRHSKEKHRSKHSKEARRRRESPDSSAGGGVPQLDVATQLAMGRVAARATREILAYKHELRRDLRELACQLDAGKALDISGIADPFLRPRLSLLFDNLTQLRRSSAGQYSRRDSAASPVLSFLAPILGESPASLATYAVPAQQPGGATPAAAVVAAPGSTAAAEACPTAPAASHTEQEPGAGLRHDGAADASAGGADAAPSQAAAIGPAPGMPAAARTEADGLAEGLGSDDEAVEGTPHPTAAPRRVLGPAMPPREVLAAAAAMAPPAEPVEGPDLIIGPPPPEMEEEADLASMDERSAEVCRVMRVLREHESSSAGLAAPAAAGAAPAPHPPDAYAVLGAQPADPRAAVRKRYWRLSLLIHPDKCAHEHAGAAFRAVALAAAELQDPAARAAADERREAAALRREMAAHAAQLERERQWRVARGQATAEDMAGPGAGAAAPPSRDAWMTDLPPEAQARRGPPKGNQTTFSSRAIGARGDTSAWTSTPQDRAMQIEGGGGAGTALLAAHAGGGAAQRTAAVVDAYNSNKRGKTLLEAHLERQQAAKKEEKRKKKRKVEGAAGEQPLPGDDWDRAGHPWRPFDREKDLEVGSAKSSNPQELLKSLPALGSKFGGGQAGRRTFL